MSQKATTIASVAYCAASLMLIASSIHKKYSSEYKAVELNEQHRTNNVTFSEENIQVNSNETNDIMNELNSIKKEKEQFINSISVLTKKKNELTEKLNETNEYAKHMQQQNEQHKSRISQLESNKNELENARNELYKYKQTINDYESKLNAIKEEKEQNMRKYNHTIGVLTKDNNKLQNDNQKLNEKNKDYENKLKENIMGVGSENEFLSVEELTKEYHQLHTQHHNNIHGDLCDLLEEKYEDNMDGNENNNDVEELAKRESYQILYPILNLANQQISHEFERLYTNVAKMLKINKEKNANKIVSNVLHSTLQTHYKSLNSIVENEDEQKDDSFNTFFDMDKMSKDVYKKLRDKYEQIETIKTGVTKYIVRCLKMVVIIQLCKPELRFDYLDKFENDTKEIFDRNKHDKLNADCDNEDEKLQTNNDSSELMEAKRIRYYYFPGLKIENNINMKENKKKKRKKEKDKQYTILCKTRVVC